MLSSIAPTVCGGGNRMSNVAEASDGIRLDDSLGVSTMFNEQVGYQCPWSAFLSIGQFSSK